MLRAGIIGCNGISGLYDQNFFERPSKFSITHAGAYHLSKNYELCSVSDIDENQLELFSNFWSVKKTYKNYQEMLDTEDLDIISICVPSNLHHKVFMDVANYDVKGIFCEKPLALNLQDALEMKSIAENKDIKVSINYFRRWNRTLKDIKSKINENEYGKFIKGIFKYTKTTQNNASHLIDLANWLFGLNSTLNFIRSHDKDKFRNVDFSMGYKDGTFIDFLHIPNDDKYIFIDCELYFENAVINLSQRGQFCSVNKICDDKIYDNFRIIENSNLIETDWKDAPLRALNSLYCSITENADVESSIDDSILVIEHIMNLENSFKENKNNGK